MRRLLQKLKRGILQLGALAYRAETTDALVLVLVFSAGWWMAAQQGGARAEALPVAMRLVLAALVIHGAALLIRRDQGVRVSLAGFAFLPFIGWLAIDAALVAPDRGLALHGLAVATMLAASWHLVLHHARRTWSHVVSLALLGAPAAILACGAFDQEDHRISGLLGVIPNPAYKGHFISAMGSPSACAAVMLLALMPALALSLNSGIKTWIRMVAGYFGALLLLGLVGTHHGWAWIGFALGSATMLWLLCKSIKVRSALAGAMVLIGWLLAPSALMRVGMLRPIPGDAEMTPWLTRAAGETLLRHPLVGGGHGSFALNFELTRPAGWQTDPVSPGSLFLHPLCEHGILGALLVLIPAGWIGWVCLRRSLGRQQVDASSIVASGGHRRMALRQSLRLGITCGVLAAALTLAVDYPCPLPGILLLLTVAAALALRLSQEEDTRLLPESATKVLTYASLLLPALLAPAILSPLASSALAAPAVEVVAAASPESLTVPGLLDNEARDALRMAEGRLSDACRLNPLAAETHAWHAQALALLIRQTPQDSALQSRARQTAETAVRLNARSPWAQSVLGSILLGAHEPAQRAKGLAHLRTAAELAPMNQAIALRLAQALGQAGATTSELRTAYERAYLTNPSRADVRDKLVLLGESKSTAPATR